MATSLIDADNLLAIDIGSTHTRAMLFDAVEDQYRLIALGIAPTSVGAPLRNVQNGILAAVGQIEEITGRTLVDSNGQLLVPSEAFGGVDHVILTLSAGPPLRTVLAGVLPQMSLQSARRLAETTYTEIVAQMHLNDRLHTEGRINALVKAHPDIVLLAGGLDGGASQAVLQMVESVGLAAYLIPEGRRPEVLFAGNTRLHAQVKDLLERLVPLHLSENLRPGLHTEQPGPAQKALLTIFRNVRRRQIPGLHEWMAPLTGRGAFYPTAYAFGRMIRFLSKVYDPSKGVMGVDIGSEATTVAAAWDGEGVLKAFSGLGLGSRLPTLLQRTSVEQITRWLPMEVPEEDVVDYLYNKALHPESIPISAEDLAVEQALARQILQTAVQKAWRDFPLTVRRAFGANLPYFEPILASGSILTKAATPGQALLLLLDGIQPSGITTVVLDTNHLLPALGAAADLNPILSVQVLESHHFTPLATVLSAAHRIAKAGVPIVRLKIDTGGGEKTTLEVKTGEIKVFRLPAGKQAQVEVRPLHGADAGFGAGRRGRVVVNGSILGLVIDGRGRPILHAAEPQARYEQNHHWLQVLGG